VIGHARVKDLEVFTTSGTYSWSFVTQIFHNGQPSHGGNRKTLNVIIVLNISLDSKSRILRGYVRGTWRSEVELQQDI